MRKVGTGRLNLDQSIRVERSFRGQVRAIFTDARRFHYTHDKILSERTLCLFETDLWKRLTDRAKGELLAYFDACLDMHWTQVHWRVRYNGKLVVGSVSVPEGEWNNVKPGAFVYNDKPDAIFSDSKVKA